ncbi:hypothetical protein LTR12_002190 [Friedmanniomyces endolithicus]|nr:hypothetical protein LTR12_002190 [Friedmanniomyces endolithicus]
MSALTTRDLNTQPINTEKNTAVGEENRPQELPHKHLLGQKSSTDKRYDRSSFGGKSEGMADTPHSGAYISPSDAIMSPASQKLAGFKQRQITKQQSGKNTTSRMLFAKTPSTSSGGPEEDEVEGTQGR